MAGFADSMKIVLVYEGGKVDDPADPGGRTNQGITQATFNAWLRGQHLPTRDVFGMTNDERDGIYKAQFWDRVHGDELHPGVDLVVFDGAVNSGPAQSIKWLQRALGVPADGVMGVKTISALANQEDDDALIARILDARMAFLRQLRTFGRFGKGWTSRINQLRTKGQAWAVGSVGPQPIYAMDMHRKAPLADAKAAPMTAPADAVASGGVVTTTLSQVTSALQPLGDVASIGHVVAYLTAAGALAAVAGLIYGRWARNRAATRAAALDIAVPPPAAVEAA